MIRTRMQGDTPFFPNMLNNSSVEVCLKEDVDAAIAKLKRENEELVDMKKSAEQILQNLLDFGLIKEWYFNGKFNAVLNADDPHLKIAELKAKLESVQATAYAESVDAGMRERKLKRALWLARAEKARYMAMIIDSFPYTQVLHFTSRKKDESGKPLGVARTAMEWWQMFQEIERKCRAKAEEYYK